MNLKTETINSIDCAIPERNQIVLFDAGANTSADVRSGVRAINVLAMTSEALIESALGLVFKTEGLKLENLTPSVLADLRHDYRRIALITALQMDAVKAPSRRSDPHDIQIWTDTTWEDLLRFRLFEQGRLNSQQTLEFIASRRADRLEPTTDLVEFMRNSLISTLDQISRRSLGEQYEFIRQNSRRISIDDESVLKERYAQAGLQIHEIKTPLTAATGNVELLTMPNRAPERRFRSFESMREALGKITKRLVLYNLRVMEGITSIETYSGREFLQEFIDGLRIYLGSIGLTLETIDQQIDPLIYDYQLLVPDQFAESYGDAIGGNLPKKGIVYQGQNGVQHFGFTTNIIDINGEPCFVLTTVDNMGGLSDKHIATGEFIEGSDWIDEHKIKEQGLSNPGISLSGLSSKIKRVGGEIRTNDCIILDDGTVETNPEIVNLFSRAERSVQIHLIIPAKRKKALNWFSR